jgi:WD40 repeat protein
LPNHAETIFAAEFNPQDKNMLATGAYDGLIKIWDV